MAKALGTTAERSIVQGSQKWLQCVPQVFYFNSKIKLALCCSKIKGQVGLFLHRYGTPRSDRVVC